MPVNDNYEIQEYYGNSSGRIFNFPFRCFSLEHLVVELLGADGSVTTLLQNTDYAVSGGLDNAGGMVTYPLASELPPLCPSERLRIYRVTPLEQPIDYPSYQQTIENALDKTTMLLQEAVNESAVVIANEAVETVNAAVGSVNEAVAAIADKVDGDGNGITDRLAFLAKLGINTDGEVELSDVAYTSGGNIDVAAYRSLLGMPAIEEDIADYTAQASSVGSMVSAIDSRVTALEDTPVAVKPQTIVAGATGELPDGWILKDCDAIASHLYPSGTTEVTVAAGLQVAAGVNGQLVISETTASDIAVDVSDYTTGSETTGYVYADIGTGGTVSIGLTSAAPQVGLSPSYDISIVTPVMTAAVSNDFTAVGSSVASTTYYNYYEAFNRVVAIQYDGWLSANNFVFNADSIYDGDEYIRIFRTDLEELTVNKVRLCPYSEGGTIYGKAYKFNLEAVDADENITILKTVEGCNEWSSGEYLEFEFDTVKTVYLQIRVLQTYGYVSCGFSDIQWIYDESMLTESSEVMTSATSPDGNAVTADSYYNATWAPYHAMDGNANTTTGTAWESDVSTGDHWFMREIPESRILKSYDMYIWNGSGGYALCMSTWTLYGSNDGTDFTELDSQSIDAAGNAATTMTFELSDNTMACRYYKFVGQSYTGTYCIIGEVSLNFKVNAGDFYNTAKQSHYDPYNNPISRVYIGEVVFADGAVDSVVNYQQGTVCTLPVNAGDNIVINSKYYLARPYLGDCGSQVRIYHENKWGNPGWLYSAEGYGVKANMTDGVLSVQSGTSYLTAPGAQIGGEFSLATNQPKRAKATVIRQW